jgi:hypothetical protein
MDNYYLTKENDLVEIFPEKGLDYEIWKFNLIDEMNLPLHKKGLSRNIFGRSASYFDKKLGIKSYLRKIIGGSHPVKKNNHLYLVDGEVGLDFFVFYDSIDHSIEKFKKYNPLNDLFFFDTNVKEEEISVRKHNFILDYRGWNLARNLDLSEGKIRNKPHKFFYDLK